MATVVLLAGGFAAKANACTIIHPNVVGQSVNPNCVIHPQQPYPLSATVHNATVGGLVVPSTQTINPNLTFQTGPNHAVTGTITTESNTFEVWLPHTYQKFHMYEQGGQLYYSLYISTQSEYAPEGDSGAFIFNATTGALVSGNSSTLYRIANEAQEADPDIVTQTYGLFGWIHSHWSRITACAGFAAGVIGAGAGIVTIVASGGLAGAAIGFLGGIMGDLGMAANVRHCF